MVAKLQYFSPKQFAKALGVSESSVKRWCDQNRITTMLTSGGHRRITLDGALDFLRKSKYSLVFPEALGLPPLCPTRTMEFDTSDPSNDERYIKALLAGCEPTCRHLVHERCKNGERASSAVETLIAASMHSVGEAWLSGAIDPYQERRACEISMRLIRELISEMPNPKPDAPVAIGGAPAGDHYQLPTAMVELTLRELGWNAISLGNNLPMECFFQASHDYRPRMIWISASYLADEDEFIASQNQFADSLPDHIVLLLGGRALSDSIRPKLRYTAYCDALSHLTELASVLAAA